MADEAGRSRLGRGLAALMGDVGEETKTTEQGRNQRRVPIEFLRPNPRNPRRHFSVPCSDFHPHPSIDVNFIRNAFLPIRIGKKMLSKPLR